MSWDKRPILAALRAKLAKELEVVRAAAASAREGATHEDAKPENEYDTRGLEQSYLAGAQAARADALAASLAELERFSAPQLAPGAAVEVGAGIVLDDGAETRRYLLMEVGGGTRVEVSGARWLVLSPSSPLGRVLLGRRTGDVVEHVIRGKLSDLEILEVF